MYHCPPLKKEKKLDNAAAARRNNARKPVLHSEAHAEHQFLCIELETRTSVYGRLQKEPFRAGAIKFSS
jgi:hypothetical protein